MSDPMQPGTAHSSQSDSGSRRRGVYALEPQVILAADADHEEALTGTTIDRTEHGMPLSMQFCYPLLLNLASGESATVEVAIQDAAAADPTDPDSNTPGSFAAYGEQPDAVTIEGNDDGSPIETAVRVNVDFGGARRFVRANPTITIPGSGESVSVAGVAIIGGTEFFPL